ncbi:SDR family NAD(P)-dependent oxidoreductase [Dermatobacter hominis]|uniref:SDR family NAD(P)-dependent oxidoreductase n=1 Tax=Dermatobacter hominis TaxID=2884263 RepID=UPI001D10B359|nr:SDR family NAD(P)-dependent oxidoreductase [Dermatobacter hominis]UDY35671.1 SDR family NAD(P)-dependent oxidoreductase [Dermatobacter hominis]
MADLAPDPNEPHGSLNEHPRTALVLGATSDIAVAVLAELARHGLRAAVLAARDPEAAARAVADAAPALTTESMAWDALEVEGHRALVERAAGSLGQVDLVVCAVGLLGHHAGRTMGPVDVDHMVRTNFAGPAAALAAAGQFLVEQGHGTIVVLSSVAGLRARRSNYVYGSTKAGLDVFAQGLSDALVGTGVRCLVVRPGFVRSRMTDGLDPAPFSTDPATVARATVAALQDPRRDVASVPRVLGPLFGVVRALPRPLWRRVAGDR